MGKQTQINFSKFAIAVSNFKYLVYKFTKQFNAFRRQFKPQRKNYPLCELYNPKQFAAKIGLPYPVVVYWLKKGEIKGVQQTHNSSWLIHFSELERLGNKLTTNKKVK